MERFGSYRLQSALAVGGMGEVYLARAAGPGGVERNVAIKVVRELHKKNPELRRMFLEEAKVSFLLTHPNLVQTYEIGEVAGQYFLVMEYVDGITAADLLEFFRGQARQPVPAAMAIYIASRVARGMEYAHTLADADGRPLNVVHRDISPTNVLLSVDGQVKIADFGLVKSALRGQESEAGVIKGKLAYMAPEQLRGGTVDRRADIYALGVMTYELLTGIHPFAREGPVTLQTRYAEPEVAPLLEVAPRLGEALSALLARCMIDDVKQREASARELGRGLDRCLRDLGLQPADYELADVVRQVRTEGQQHAEGPHPFDRMLGLQLERVAPQEADGVSAFASSSPPPEPSPAPPARPPFADPAVAAAPAESLGAVRVATRRLPLLIALVALAALVIVAAWTLRKGGGEPPPGSGVAAAGYGPRDARAPLEGALVAAADDASTADRGLPDAGKLDAAIAVATRRPSRQRPRRAPPPGSLSVNSEPWSIVYVDGERVRGTPLRGHPLAAGRHTVRLVHPPRGLSATRVVRIKPGAETRLIVELEGK